MATINQNHRVGVYVDVQNLYYSAKHLYSSYVDFGALLARAVNGRQMIEALGYVVKAEIPKQEEFFKALEHAGYKLKSKDLQIFPGGLKKGNWDVGMTVDIIAAASRLDAMVLVTGDGDFKELIEYLKNQAVRVEVMAFGKSASAKLKDTADEFIDLDKTPEQFLLKSIARPPRPSQRTPTPAPTPPQTGKKEFYFHERKIK